MIDERLLLQMLEKDHTFTGCKSAMDAAMDEHNGLDAHDIYWMYPEFAMLYKEAVSTAVFGWSAGVFHGARVRGVDPFKVAKLMASISSITVLCNVARRACVPNRFGLEHMSNALAAGEEVEMPSLNEFGNLYYKGPDADKFTLEEAHEVAIYDAHVVAAIARAICYHTQYGMEPEEAEKRAEYEMRLDPWTVEGKLWTP